MAYIAMARKWRPQSFSDMVGQEHIAKTLENAIQGGRLHHAFLFTGTRGVGKTRCTRVGSATAARISPAETRWTFTKSMRRPTPASIISAM